MKLKKLACKNCGAKLEVEEGASQAKCNFCGTTFSVENAYSEGYNYTKGVLKATDEHTKENLKTFGKFPIIFAILTIFVIIIILGGMIFSIINSNKKWNSNVNESEKKTFNYSYEIHSGKQYSFYLTNVLDDIVTNNKTNKNHIITVSYKDITSTEEEKIKEIRNMLSNNTYYDVSLDYDSNGYVNKFTITDINN